jgi:hypothetical protein
MKLEIKESLFRTGALFVCSKTCLCTRKNHIYSLQITNTPNLESLKDPSLLWLHLLANKL